MSDSDTSSLHSPDDSQSLFDLDKTIGYPDSIWNENNIKI